MQNRNLTAFCLVESSSARGSVSAVAAGVRAEPNHGAQPEPDEAKHFAAKLVPCAAIRALDQPAEFDGRRSVVRRAARDAGLPRRRDRGRPTHERAHELADECELRQRRQLAKQPRQLGTPRFDLQNLERGSAQFSGKRRGAGAHASVAQQPPAAGHSRAHRRDGLAFRPRFGPVFHQFEAHFVAERTRLRLARFLLIFID